MPARAAKPIALASGVTPENVDAYLPFVDAYLVATGISLDFEHLDASRTRALVERVHDGPEPGLRASASKVPFASGAGLEAETTVGAGEEGLR